MVKQLKVLVTGGAGFIGSHIVDELVKNGIDTHVIDDLSTGDQNNLNSNKNENLFHIHIGNIKNLKSTLNKIHDIDVVFHQAAIVSVQKSITDPQLVHNTNVNLTLQLMDYCVQNRVKFIFASSAAVYGKVNDVTISEDHYCKPISPYGASKLAIENYLHSYKESFGMEYVVLRYFNVFGPRQKYTSEYGGVIPTFIDKLLKKESPVIYGEGLQTRDFVSVTDVVQANILAMNSRKASGQIFNVGTGSGTTIIDLLQMLKKVTRFSECKTIFQQRKVGDIHSSVACVDKIQHMLGYRPTDMESELEKLVHALEKYNGCIPLALTPRRRR
ncbi:MAG TPA: NAD-dependent epimerase/dehydratase family protein [Nitrososphaeraceae archaeon]|nr:NAD-dependent epimerase/dehydratase family protein [Nitrososphaeraceae archaeon]